MLAFACVITLASSLYDDLVNRKQRAPHKRPLEDSTALFGLCPKPPEALPDTNPVRGYDNPELFRKDLWLRRMDRARREHAVLAGPMRQAQGHGTTPEDPKRRVSEILAHHPGVNCNN